MKRKRLGEILIEGGLLQEKKLEQALARQKGSNKRLGRILVEMGLATEEDICRTLSIQLNIPMISLKNRKIDQKVMDLVPAKLCFKRRLIPLLLGDRGLYIAMNNPTDYEAIDEVAFVTGHRVNVATALEKEILDALIRFCPPEEHYLDETNGSEYAANLVQVVEDFKDLDNISFEKLEKAAQGGFILQLTNGIIANAIKRNASDIHIEPKEKDVVVRLRIDGIMRDVMNFGKVAQASVISRVKIMAGLDITIRKKPQDGRSRVRIAEKVYDLRVSSLPTFYGEKIVIRILEPKEAKPLKELGFPERELNIFQDLLARPQGLILVTGPTGSGKTTTLYAALKQLSSPEINIVTIEDPIEYSLSGISQVQVNLSTGLTFAKGLRSLLRQDPNVVMIGEIRDKETATIALQAAQTGHLVLSTLHTNDAASAVIRLVDIGVEPYVISSTLLGVLAQRLVRKICEGCSIGAKIESAILSRFPASPLDTFKRGEGCDECEGTGYKGRTGIYELLVVNREISGLITERVSDREIFGAACRTGMRSMTEDGFEKAKQGIITLGEVLRIAPPSETSFTGPQPATAEKEVPSGLQPVEPGIRRDRIIVVDDDEALRRYAKKILEDEYYGVIQAVDGKDALEKIFENPPDLIIVDYRMPIMDGIEFIEKLKSHSRLSMIPTIMLTVTDTEESEIKALRVGADDWIRKPIHKQRLLERVKRLLRSRHP